MKATIKIDIIDYIKENYSYSETIDFIRQLDLSIADCGFTEDLLKSIVKSARSDFSKEDLIKLIRDAYE